ncbi:glycosyltransferase family 4 protein [Pedobacter sp. WC2501]|uniref:glycosyltransferase family 4 protein n=1 Tax=Pedobacter sp. WC2501 TaxID=3461400 RepID=UPI0040462200
MKKIIVCGTRGIPHILGGVETHCEELYPVLVNNFGLDVTVIGRSGYITESAKDNFKGVKLKTIYAPKSKAFEAIVHSFLAVLWAAIKRPDVLHIHAVGPNLVAPFARLLGLNVVMTHHGPDYERKKWGRLAKAFLKVGEWAGVKFANEVIVISEEIRKGIEHKYSRYDSKLIPNGVSIIGKPIVKPEYLQKYGLDGQPYLFTLGRFVPEKGFDYLIRSYEKSGLSLKYKLVIAGDADHESEYSRSLKEQAELAGIIMPGFIKGDALAQLFSNCSLFILPSFYEGLPIALLEGMAYGLPILASDIPANMQVELPADRYFPVGNEDALCEKLQNWHEVGCEPTSYNMDKYKWEDIAAKTVEVYKQV